MDVEQAVRQAIAVGSIAQGTVDKLSGYVMSQTDACALNILADALISNFVSVVEV